MAQARGQPTAQEEGVPCRPPRPSPPDTRRRRAAKPRKRTPHDNALVGTQSVSSQCRQKATTKTSDAPAAAGKSRAITGSPPIKLPRGTGSEERSSSGQVPAAGRSRAACASGSPSGASGQAVPPFPPSLLACVRACARPARDRNTTHGKRTAQQPQPQVGRQVRVFTRLVNATCRGLLELRHRPRPARAPANDCGEVESVKVAA